MKLTHTLVVAVCVPAAALFANPGPADPGTRSAHLAGEAQTVFLAAVRERIVINETARGPFGLVQEPNSEVEIWKPQDPPVSLDTVLERMKVEVVIPGKRLFYSNGRWFRQGEEFPLLHGDHEIPVRVEAVEVDKVTFRDLKTEKTASLTLVFLPRSLPFGRGAVVLPKGVKPTPRNGGRGAPFRP